MAALTESKVKAGIFFEKGTEEVETGNIDWVEREKIYIGTASDVTNGYHNNIKPYIANGSTLFIPATGDKYMFEKSANTWHELA